MKQLFIFIMIITLTFCKKETIVIPDNTPFQDKYISTIQVENYVNKLFIDLIGREPLNTEMAKEVEKLKGEKLSFEAREQLIIKLQSDSSFLEGDSSYQKAYYHRFYDVLKLKMLEGIENEELYSQKGNYENTYNGAVFSGDSATAAKFKKEIDEINNILSISYDYRKGLVTINEIFIRLMDNYVYDVINMNTFNFVNATFDDMLFRFPTSFEYNTAFEMIENNESGYLLGLTGTNKGEYLHLLVNSREFYEGLITWSYKSYLVRDPKPVEVNSHLEDLINNQDLQKLQLEILKTNEYAAF